MKRTLVTAVLLILVLCGSVAGKEKDASVERRKEIARRVQIEIEHAGWASGYNTTVRVVKKMGCGPICTQGDALVLRVWLVGATVESMDRFEQQIIEPMKDGLREAGFIGVEVRSGVKSQSYPDGVHLIWLKQE